LKLGKLLSADWLISGMVAPAQTRTQIWTKVIDMHSGIVMEIDSTSLNGDLPSSVIEMGKFVGKVGRNSAGPKPYVALGPFRDYSMKAGGRPDWSGELQELMEKAFRERGFGIVEREAIGMIAQEIHLDGTGLTAVGTNRVKLQPAFWLVDGGSQWLEESGTNLMLTLRLQKVGAKPTLLRITNTPGPVLMQTIRRELAGALGAGQNASAAAATAEGRVQADRGDELARARNPLADPEYLNSARGDVAEARRDNARKAVQHYEAAYALNPNDLQAKYMLGHALCADPETLERGKQLLWQIVKVNDAKLLPRALNALAIAELAEWGPKPGERMGYHIGDIEQQIILLTNNMDLSAKLKLGSSLVTYPSARNQQRGAGYLEDVIKSGSSNLAASAKQALAQYQSQPPESRSKPLARTVAYPSSAASAPAPAQPRAFEPARPLKPEEPAETARREFLQRNFDRFMLANFEKDGPQVARFHRLPVKEGSFDYEGKRYCGFRFTVPASIDGNLKWMHVLAKTESQKTFSATNFSWYIVAKSGRMVGFEDYSHLEVQRYKKLSERFPFTKKFYEQELPRGYLKPGGEYAIWFSYVQPDLPDIEFAITIASHRGYQQFGILPMQ
jgi:hypothetical protein